MNPNFTNEFLEIVSCRTPSEFSFDMQFNPGAGLHDDIGDGIQWITTFRRYATFTPESSHHPVVLRLDTHPCPL